MATDEQKLAFLNAVHDAAAKNEIDGDEFIRGLLTTTAVEIADLGSKDRALFYVSIFPRLIADAFDAMEAAAENKAAGPGPEDQTH